MEVSLNSKISVITVVYNGVAGIELTIKSVLNQTYKNIEYLVIDGGSKDGTADVVNKYSDKITYWISEPDYGLYFAMNKGIDKATGDWIILMNCGDTFYDDETVSSIFSNVIPSDISAIIGGAFVRSYWTDFYIHARKESDIWKSFVHQSLFTRRELNLKYKFNTDFVTASDFDFVYTLISEDYKFLSVDRIVSTILYASGGYTSRNEILNKKESLRAIRMHSKNWKTFLYHYSYHYIGLVRKYLAVLANKISPKLIISIRRMRDRDKL